MFYKFANISARPVLSRQEMDNPFIWRDAKHVINVSQEYYPEIEMECRRRGCTYDWLPLAEVPEMDVENLLQAVRLLVKYQLEEYSKGEDVPYGDFIPHGFEVKQTPTSAGQSVIATTMPSNNSSGAPTSNGQAEREWRMGRVEARVAPTTAGQSVIATTMPSNNSSGAPTSNGQAEREWRMGRVEARVAPTTAGQSVIATTMPMTIVHCNKGENRSRTVVEAFHFALTGEHFADPYKGFANHLIYNCEQGFLPPLEEMEHRLRDDLMKWHCETLHCEEMVRRLTSPDRTPEKLRAMLKMERDRMRYMMMDMYRGNGHDPDSPLCRQNIEDALSEIPDGSILHYWYNPSAQPLGMLAWTYLFYG